MDVQLYLTAENVIKLANIPTDLHSSEVKPEAEVVDGEVGGEDELCNWSASHELVVVREVRGVAIAVTRYVLFCHTCQEQDARFVFTKI